MTEPLHPDRNAELRRVQEELAALGEDPLVVGEDLDERRPDADDVAFFERHIAIAKPLGSHRGARGELDDLARERVWRAVGAHRKGRGGGSGGPARWAGPLLAAAAVVAVVIFVPWKSPPGESGPSAQETAALGDSARAGLEALGVDRSPGADATRVRALLAELAGPGDGGGRG